MKRTSLAFPARIGYLPWFITLAIIGLLFALFPGFTQPAKSLFLRLISSPSGVLTEQAQDIRAIFIFTRELRTLLLTNAALETENLALKAQLMHEQQLAHENELLRTELGVIAKQAATFDFLPAAIIGRSPSTFLQYLVIDQGSWAGVRVGDAVVSQGFLIGRVESTLEQTATVRPITASRSLIPIILVTSRATGLLEGGLAGLAAVDLPSDVSIEPGEGVTTSGLGQEIPEGIPVGTVDRLLSRETDFVQKAAIHSPIKFSRLEKVFVVKPKSS